MRPSGSAKQREAVLSMRIRGDARRVAGGAGRWTLPARLALVLAPVLALTVVGTAFADSGGGGTFDITVSPSVGAPGSTITLTGDNLPPNDPVAVGYASGSCQGSVTAIAGATGAANGQGNVTVTFTWPQTDPGQYVICVTDTQTHHVGQATGTFTTVQTPSITVSGPVYSGQPVTVTGQHFIPTGAQFGGTVQITYGTGGNGCTTSAATATVGSDGSFTAQVTAPYASSDTTITIIAVEPQGTCGSTNPAPTVQAQTTASVSPAPVITITPQVNAGQSITVTGQHFLPAATTVAISYGVGANADGCSTKVGTVKTDQSGSFTYQFKAPDVSKDSPITVLATSPDGSCSQPTLRAAASGTVKAVQAAFPAIWQYCVIGLLLLLLLLLLLFLLFRRRKQDEPVTIEERDRVFVPTSSAGANGPAGATLIDRQIVARDKKGREVVIAEEVTTVEEEELN
jgi:hypothetical protein